MKYREMEAGGGSSPAEVKSIKRPAGKDAAFSMIFTSAVGAGTLGSGFGVPGTLVGVAIGIAIGMLIKGKQKNG